ncbi:MAG: right-handed parallel beta-helix repeat-containing protein [Calditrichaeota bacterium]|nr:right-handed parallel beta-helix repeat-containing protein [Calditrichota bacterium]
MARSREQSCPYFHVLTLALLLLRVLCAVPSLGQPSGGPYGPLHQSYAIPQVEGKVYYVAPDGKPDAAGNSPSSPTTIESAIARAKSGDSIVLRGGIYRTGRLVFNQAITIQPYLDEQPILKGTYLATSWQNLGNGLWVTKWPHPFPSRPADWWNRDREGKVTPLHRFNNDMVFVDGRFLQSAGWEGEVDENTFYIDYESGRVYIGVDPTDKKVEITAFDVALLRTTREVHGKKPDRKGPKIRGITFTQYAFRALEVEGAFPEGAADEATFGKDVVGTLLENCTISYCSRVGAYLRGDSLTIRHCRVSDTSTEGIYIMSSNDVLLERNIFTRNNIERVTGYYPAAVKIFNQCHRVTCRDNLVIDLPYSNGIWYDVGNVDGRFLNNWVENVGSTKGRFPIERPWPSNNGFFFEISKGAICAGNVFVNCDHGLWVLNSSDVHIYNNTFVNSTACISRNARSAAADQFGWHASTGPDVDKRHGHVFVNNLLYADEGFERPLLYVWQPAVLCERLQHSQLRAMDHNLFLTKASRATVPLIVWGPEKTDSCYLVYESFDSFQKAHPEYAAQSWHVSWYPGQLFKSLELGDYRLLDSSPGAAAGRQLPTEIGKLLGTDGGYVGAFPPLHAEF